MTKNISIEDLRVGDILINPYGYIDEFPRKTEYCEVLEIIEKTYAETRILLRSMGTFTLYLATYEVLYNTFVAQSDEEKAFILLKAENND